MRISKELKSEMREKYGDIIDSINISNGGFDSILIESKTSIRLRGNNENDIKYGINQVCDHITDIILNHTHD